jgi:hypothetical protein
MWEGTGSTREGNTEVWRGVLRGDHNLSFDLDENNPAERWFVLMCGKVRGPFISSFYTDP